MHQITLRGFHISVDDSITECPVCGLKYDVMRTGHTFETIRQLMWVYSEDKGQWRNKRRNGVLGFWREFKTDMWIKHLIDCCADKKEINAVTVVDMSQCDGVDLECNDWF